MVEILLSFIPVAAILLLYFKIYKHIEEKESKWKGEISDAFLLMLVGGSAIPFMLISFALILSEIFK